MAFPRSYYESLPTDQSSQVRPQPMLHVPRPCVYPQRLQHFAFYIDAFPSIEETRLSGGLAEHIMGFQLQTYWVYGFALAFKHHDHRYDRAQQPHQADR